VRPEGSPNDKFIAKLLLAVAALNVCLAAQTSAPAVSRVGQLIHESAIVIDTHADTPQRFVDQGFDMGTVTPVTKGQVDLEKARAGNLGAEFFSIWVEPDKFQGHYVQRAMDLIDSVYEQVRRHPDRMAMAYTAQDIVDNARAMKNRKLATLMGLEGGHAINNDLRVLRDYYRLGVRYMTLTWSNSNEWADSSGDLDDPKVQHHNGLTPFGKQVVLEMNRLGMMVDVSHVSDKTFWDTIAVSKAPVIASHSACRALDSAKRNMTDDMLKAVAKNGGVVMVNFYSAFVDENTRKAFASQAAERKAAIAKRDAQLRAEGKPVTWENESDVDRQWAAKIPRPPFKSLIDQIEHAIKVAGIEHVGLGADWDGIDSLPQGIDSVADLPKITQALVDRGYDGEDIKKVLGENLLRVFQQVERVSREMQAQQRAANE
jgi:membrane dipeptidase